jgi:hypothetical protein
MLLWRKAVSLLAHVQENLRSNVLTDVHYSFFSTRTQDDCGSKPSFKFS